MPEKIFSADTEKKKKKEKISKCSLIGNTPCVIHVSYQTGKLKIVCSVFVIVMLIYSMLMK